MYMCAIRIQIVGCVLICLHQVDPDSAVSEDSGFDLAFLILCGVVDINIAFFICDRSDFFDLGITDGGIFKSVAFYFRKILFGDGTGGKVIYGIVSRKFVTQVEVEAAARNLCLSFGGNSDVGKAVHFKACTRLVNVRF